MRTQVTVMKQIHNWIAVVAVLAVTLLGAVAINRTASDRDQTTRSAVVAMCEQVNSGRYQVNVEFKRLDSVAQALDGALRVAQNERGQSTDDRIEYARLQAILSSTNRPQFLSLTDCDQMFER